jgi:hypothetical protein
MSCTLTQVVGRPLTGCTEFTLGGVEKILIADKETISGQTESTGGTITALSGTFYEYFVTDQTANFSQELDASRRFYSQTVNLTLEGLTAEQSLELENLARLRGLFVLVKSKDQKWFAFGHSGPGLKNTTQTDDSGTADADQSTVVLALSGVNKGRYREVETAVAEAL